jgi:hypothetical protein
VEFMAAVRRKPARASSRSVRLCGWAGLAGLPSWERVVLWQGEGGGFEFAWRLRDLFSGAFERQLYRQQDHMTVI